MNKNLTKAKHCLFPAASNNSSMILKLAISNSVHFFHCQMHSTSTTKLSSKVAAQILQFCGQATMKEPL